MLNGRGAEARGSRTHAHMSRRSTTTGHRILDTRQATAAEHQAKQRPRQKQHQYLRDYRNAPSRYALRSFTQRSNSSNLRQHSHSELVPTTQDPCGRLCAQRILCRSDINVQHPPPREVVEPTGTLAHDASICSHPISSSDPPPLHSPPPLHTHWSRPSPLTSSDSM